ncbi:hypothetical protein Ahy_A06g026404 [Arachis hypogaea]|uniref:Amino acid transporter transmembrane domain-containing protein n=1 Tax=Arachis hypogaea TaxID=3818 RepID=A0A445CKE6_ARAHY|nr:hypothetical protein Ahy_A06g026404 [Arachis hypogaea]
MNSADEDHTRLRVTTTRLAGGGVSAVTGITMLIGISILFFGSLLGFLGGFAFAPTLYFLQCIIWLKLKKPRKYGLSWTINWPIFSSILEFQICIVIGVLKMTLSPIGALRNIIVSAKNYKFFS